MSGVVVHLLPRPITESIRFMDRLPHDRALLLARVIVDGLVRLLRVGAVDEHVALTALTAIVVRFVGAVEMEDAIGVLVGMDSGVVQREARRRLRRGGVVTPVQTDLLVRLARVADPAARARR